MSTELLTIKQAADYLGLNRQTLYLRIWKGELEPVRLLGKMGIPLAVLEAEKARRERRKARKKSNGNGHK
jgi:excisionase family DNA binding protein